MHPILLITLTLLAADPRLAAASATNKGIMSKVYPGATAYPMGSGIEAMPLRALLAELASRP